MLDWLFLFYVISVGVWFGLRYKREKSEFAVRFAFAVAFPLAGLMLPIFWRKRWHERNRQHVEQRIAEIDEATSNEGRFPAPTVIRKLEVENEVNIVPFEEALILNEVGTRRRAMIDLLKKDTMEYLDVLRLAVSNEDTETSHYAVSAVVEIKRKLNLAMQDLAVKYEENKSDLHLLRAYADILRMYMRSGFLDHRTMLKLQTTYIDVLEHWIVSDPKEAHAFKEAIDTQIDIGLFEAAERNARLYLEQLPLDEDAYLALMKVHFSNRQYERLQQTLERLKQSPIRLSNHALTLVRFWSEGVSPKS
ncbi:hypothetical protein [Paenibacillus methanolicus]|uniref:Uncharacterized protein n=1 Tax=Paenibacillus methanolicus TaxID=582686 RepID=A0A5S5BNX5_9BACL|nr:hypothetical protein [Paenibacillus methanolicus]TYP68634.1 hypothetical protein BCM02_11831 [Paenibacillus methanolicus]